MNPLEKIADTLIPPGGFVQSGAINEGVPQEIERLLLDADPISRSLVHGAVWAVDLSAFFSSHGARLSSLPARAAEEHLTSMGAQGGIPGALVQLLRHLIEGAYTSRDSVRTALGIRGPPLSDLGPLAPRLPTQSIAEVSVAANRDCDVCIIGSGAGGAPAAKVLAASGLRVLILEEGNPYNRADFRGPPLARMARHYRGAGLLTTLGRPVVSLVEASAVGGTTVFNSGSCFRPPDTVVRRWASDLALHSFSPERLAPFFERAEKTLGVGIPTWDILGGNARAMKKGADALGLREHGVIPRPAPGCRGSDECVIGCPRDAKRSMALSYLPEALARGARIISGCRVRNVRPIREGKFRWEVRARFGGGKGESSPGANVAVRARWLVVAGGALHTPTLLSGRGLRRSRSHCGRHLRIHPSFEVAGEMSEEVHGWEGVLQSYFIRGDDPKILLEATFQPRGILSTAGLTPRIGREYKDYLSLLHRWAIVGGMVSEDSEGQLITETSGHPWISYSLNPGDIERIREAMALSARVLLAAGARHVFLPIGAGRSIDRPGDIAGFEADPLPRESLHLFAFHPLGTARMAGEADLGMIDDRGLVWGEDGLAVSDASMLPGSPQVNPMISIIGLAERNAELWAKEWIP